MARSFKQPLVLAIVAAQIAVLAGTTVSYTYGIATGGSIVVVAIGVYADAALVNSAWRS